LVAATLVMTLGTTVAATQGTAGAAVVCPPHCYAVGWDDQANISAVRQWRPDELVYSNTCIYQDQWEIVTSDAQYWIEFGTSAGNQCATIPGWNWFWGYGFAGNFDEVGHQLVGPGPNHKFSFYYYLGHYYYYIDSTLMGNFASTSFGWRAEAGLESGDQYTSIPLYAGTGLSLTISGGAFQDWSTSYEDRHRDYAYGLCGWFNGATEFDAEESPPSC
jgi:hypothetical protein